MLLNLHRPANPVSKANIVFDAFAKGYKTRDITDKNSVPTDGIHVFWGLVGNNAKKIDECKRLGLPWVFTDMPYFGRWDPSTPSWSTEFAYWRIVPFGIHPTQDLVWNDGRNFGQAITGLRWSSTKKDSIMIAPSSQTMTNYNLAMTDEEWIRKMKLKIVDHYPNYAIKVRMKPRGKGTSGPSVADVSIGEDLENCAAIVTMSSISGVDALQLNKPVISETSKINPIGTDCLKFGDAIKPVEDNVVKKRNMILSNYQFRPREIEEGLPSRLFECYSLM